MTSEPTSAPQTAPITERRNPDRADRRASQQLSGHLELLAEMSSHLAASLNTDETISTALSLITHYVKAEGGSLFMLDLDGQHLVCRSSVGPIDITGISIKATDGIVGQCVTRNESRIVRDVSKDPDFIAQVDEDSGFTTRSILCAPMTVHDEHLGAIELVNKREGNGLFSEPDLMMLQTLASATALAILNARMAGKLMAQERMRRELEMAAEIQRSLLPVNDPKLPVTGINVPARKVSGDFYDFFSLPDGRIYFTVGDVSGKGMNAALMMSKTASLFRCLGKKIHQPGELLSRINAEICETASRGMFVTMACGLFDPHSGTIRLANAGHEPPLLMDAEGQFSSISAGAPPLGIVPPLSEDESLPESEVELTGSTLYLFTDGVTEGNLANGDKLDLSGLKHYIHEHRNETISSQINGVAGLLQSTRNDLHDDITLLAIQGQTPA